jgi:acetyl esterase
MTIHPGFDPMFEAMAPFFSLDWSTVPVDQLRAFADNPMAVGERLAMARVENLSIPVGGASIPARLYVPEGAGEIPPLTVFFHGGGWVLGTLETHDATCRALAHDARCAVLSIGYRLAPEHRYPTAAEDCYAATKWAAGNAGRLGVDSTHLAVAGDSAGGNLAAAVSLMARDRGGPAIAHQLLIYPVADRQFDTASYKENGGAGNFLSTVAMQRFWDEYLGDTRTDAADLAVLLRLADVSGLPPATVVVAEHDPLRDEGLAYAAKLAAAGVPVTTIEAPGMIHGFFGMIDLVPHAAQWTSAAAAEVGKALA